MILRDLFVFWGQMAFEPLDTFRQLRQAAKPGKLLLKFFKGPSRSAPDDLPASHDLAGGNPSLRPDDRAVFDSAVVGDPDLSTNGHIPPNYGRPRYPRLRRDHCILSNAYVVRDVNKVVQFRASPYLRVIEGSAINRGICADFHVILNIALANLWKFPALAIFRNIAKAVRADYAAGMQDYTVGEANTRI